MPLDVTDDIAALAPQFDVGALGLHLPAVQQWFGVWAIEPAFGQQFAQRMQGFNLAQHAQIQATQVVVKGDQATAPDAALARSRSTLRVLSGGVGLIDVSGSMMKYASSLSDSTSTVQLRQMIRTADRSDEISQILIRVETPGGTVPGVAEAFADLRSAKKPTTIYVEDLCASAGMWFSSGADRIFANSMARIGSIGVFMVIEDSSKAAEQMGFKVHLVTTGEFKGMGSPGIAITDPQIAYVQERINESFDAFLQAVSEGRNIPLAQVKAIANGKVYGAQEAVDLKLIDGIKTFDEVVAELRDGHVTKPKSRGARGKPSAAAQEGDEMAKETTDKPEPQAATLAELKTACKGAPSDFILAQLEAGATTSVASGAWAQKQIDDLRAENEKLKSDKVESDKKAAEASKKDEYVGGAKPVPEGKGKATEPVGDDPIAQWNAQIKELTASGKSQRAAVKELAAENPDLHQAYLAAYQARHGNATTRKKQQATAG